MKKCILMFIVLSVIAIPLMAQEINVENPTVTELIDGTVSIVQGIQKSGFKNWIMENWYFALMMLVGIFSIIATATPNETDNKYFNYVLNAINWLGGNFGKAKNGSKKKP